MFQMAQSIAPKSTHLFLFLLLPLLEALKLPMHFAVECGSDKCAWSRRGLSSGNARCSCVEVEMEVKARHRDTTTSGKAHDC